MCCLIITGDSQPGFLALESTAEQGRFPQSLTPKPARVTALSPPSKPPAQLSTTSSFLVLDSDGVGFLECPTIW